MSLSDIASRAMGGTGLDRTHGAGVSANSRAVIGSMSLSDLARAAFQGMGSWISPQQQDRHQESGRSDSMMSASQAIGRLQLEQRMATPPTALLSVNAGHHIRLTGQNFLNRAVNPHETANVANGAQTASHQQAFRSELFDSFNSRLRSDAADQFSTI